MSIARVHGDFCQLRQGVQTPIVIVALLQILNHANDIQPKVGKTFDKRFGCKPAVHQYIVGMDSCCKGRLYHAQGCFRFLQHAFHPGFPTVGAVVNILVGFLIAVPKLGR